MANYSSLSTLNAKVAAVAIALGAVSLHILSQLDASLIPMRLLIIGVLVMGAWAFADEMGMRKPLNRAGMICFSFSMLALASLVLEPLRNGREVYLLIYTLCLLCALLLWSIAFLHRQRDLKIAGSIGVAASVIPILIIVAGHISVGAGAFFGVQVLFDSANQLNELSSKPVRVIEGIFILWSIATAVQLWRGRISAAVI